LFIQGKEATEEYVKWLKGEKKNVFTIANGEEDIGPGIKGVVFHPIPVRIFEGEPLYLVAINYDQLGKDGEAQLRQLVEGFATKTKSPVDKEAVEALVSVTKTVRLNPVENPAGRYKIGGKLTMLTMSSSQVVEKPQGPWIALQSLVNQGIPIEAGVQEESGPDVTSWFARDLVKQLQARQNRMGKATDLLEFADQAANDMSYKWIDYGGPVTGRGVNTVVLAGRALRRNILGNISLTFVGAILGPEGFTTKVLENAASLGKGVEKVFADPLAARILKLAVTVDNEVKPAMFGYSIIPYHRVDRWGVYRFEERLGGTRKVAAESFAIYLSSGHLSRHVPQTRPHQHHRRLPVREGPHPTGDPTCRPVP
jgi:hypothetical protein